MDTAVLSTVLKNLQSLCGANGAIFGYAQDLLILLMTIDFVVFLLCKFLDLLTVIIFLLFFLSL